MKETEPIKLKKMDSQDKTIFLDTVVFGIVLKKPQTENQLKDLKNTAVKDMYKIYNYKTTYVSPPDCVELPPENRANLSPF